MKLDDLLKELDDWTFSHHQDVYVSINGQEYLIKDCYPCADAVDPLNPDSMEFTNYRIVLEV